MFGTSRNFKSLFSRVEKTARHGHKIILIMTLTLMIGGLTPTLPAQAAPNRELKVNYKAEIILPPAPICAGRDHEFRVKVTFTSQEIRNGKVVKTLKDIAAGGIYVDAWTDNSDVATVDYGKPATSKSTSWYTSKSKYGAGGEVAFTLNTWKAGKAKLFVQANLENGGKWLPPEKTIKVVNCEYTMKMLYRGEADSGTGFVASYVGILPETKLTWDGEQLKGEGTFAIQQYDSWAPCWSQWNEGSSPTQITGTVGESSTDEQELNLQLAFQATTMTGTGWCPPGPLYQPEQNYDPNLLGVTGVTLSADGGSIMVSALYGSMTVVVVPVEESSAVSSR